MCVCVCVRVLTFYYKDFQTYKSKETGNSLAVQWLRLRASTVQGMGLIPGRGTKIPHAMRVAKNNNNNK